MPGVHSVHLALSISTTVNDRSTFLHLRIAVEPLFAQHRDERGEKGSGQTRVKGGLDTDGVGIGAGPWRGNGSGTGWDIAKRDVGHNLEEAIAQLCVVWLEIGLNSNDESGCDRREQAGLFLGKIY